MNKIIKEMQQKLYEDNVGGFYVFNGIILGPPPPTEIGIIFAFVHISSLCLFDLQNSPSQSLN